jgi:hypothetical protein
MVHTWNFDGVHNNQMCLPDGGCGDSGMLRVQIRQMCQILHLAHLVPDRFLIEPQSFNLVVDDADRFNATECCMVLASEVS